MVFGPISQYMFFGRAYLMPPASLVFVLGCGSLAGTARGLAVKARSAKGRSFPPPGRLGLLHPRHRQSRQANLRVAGH
jgi:hypothetical protein